MNEVDFSILMATYNRPHFLRDALDSILAQTHQNWELFVVDDGSPDPVTIPVVDNRIHLIRLVVNGGKAAALNHALGIAKGKYIAFLDDDDAWSPFRLENALLGHRIADAVVCDTMPMDKQDRVPQFVGPRMITDIDRHAAEMPASLCAVSVRRDICLPMNPELRASQDLDWTIRVRPRIREWAHVDSPDFIWRRHSQVRHLNGTDARLSASKRMLREHRDFYMARPRLRAHRQYRIGTMQYQLGRYSEAIASVVRSLIARPNAGAVKLLFKTLWSFIARRRPQA